MSRAASIVETWASSGPDLLHTAGREVAPDLCHPLTSAGVSGDGSKAVGVQGVVGHAGQRGALADATRVETHHVVRAGDAGVEVDEAQVVDAGAARPTRVDEKRARPCSPDRSPAASWL